MRRVVLPLLLILGGLALLWALRTAYVVYGDPASAFSDALSPAATEIPVPEDARWRLPLSPTPEPTLSPEETLRAQVDLDFMKDRVNILLVGFDQSPERTEAGSTVYRSRRNNFRSDVLMLLAIDFAEKRVHMISIPRDTYTPIYRTKGRWKINAAFSKGGAAEGDGFLYAQKTVEMLFGVPVPYYAGVDMAGLKTLVDGIGGVDYDVDVRITLNGRTLEPGMQRLNGQQALDYCRARKGISTDLGRNDRQQRMLMAVFDELKRSNKLTALPALYAAARDDLHTNLSMAQIASLASFALRIDRANILRTTLRGEYVNNVYNASYYVLQNKALVQLVEEEFGVTIKRDRKYDLATVKRDKAAAAARKAAEEAEALASTAVVPADATGRYDDAPRERARAANELLLEAIDAGASETEIRRLHELLLSASAALLRAFDTGADAGAYPALKSILPRE